jgi:hypothetical protein
LNPDRIPAALFAAAILSSHRDLDVRTRVKIISHVPAFDLESDKEARNALKIAFHSAGIPVSRNFTSARLAAAAVSAEQWLAKGIFVVSGRSLVTPERCAQHIPEVVFACGDRSIASSGAAAILNSRKPRRVSPGDGWITDTRSLVRYAEQAKLIVVSSYGNISYSMVSRLVLGRPMIAVCDDVLPFMFPARSEEFFSKYGDLFQWDSTLFISPFPPGTNLPREIRSAERDLVVAALASVLLVAEIRPDGNMERIVKSAACRNIKVIRYYDCKTKLLTEGDENLPIPPFDKWGQGRSLNANWHKAVAPAQPVVDGKLPPLCAAVPTFTEVAGKTRYLIHYTRSCPGPWPGQTVAEYCLSLVEGCERSAHTGFDTLLRILGENLVRGSSRLTRRAHRVVSLTECTPEEISTLTRWRRSLIRWSFEPYGIAFPKDDLFKLGALPVIYAVEAAFQDLSADLQHLFQLQGRNSTDWSAEKEWRVPGDVVLNEALLRKMVVIVSSEEEAAIIADQFGYVVALAPARLDSSL